MYKLVLDIEATCTNKNEFPREEMEIIEIGAVILEDKDTIASFQCFIRPEIHPILTDFCKELTTIQQPMVDSAENFSTKMKEFLEWVEVNTKGQDYEFYSWGAFDKNIIDRQCKKAKIDASKLIASHKNAKDLFGIQNKLDCAPGVSKALKMKNMKFNLAPYRALSDAINIAKLVLTLN